MEDTTLRMVYIFTDIILPMIAGYVAKRRSWLTPDQSNWLIRFNIIVIMTSLTLLSFWVLPMRTDLLSLPFFAFFNGLLPLAVVLLLGRQRKFSSFVDRGSYLIAAIPANTGMLGGLCSYILYGEMSYAYVQIIGVFQNLLMFFVLFPMGYYYQHGGKDRNFFVFFKDNWKSIFINWNQLSVVALVIGTALHAAGIPRPAAGTIVIVMATPCAINALITERLYDLNVNLAMAPFITTQLLYILILYPAFYLLVSWGYLPFK